MLKDLILKNRSYRRFYEDHRISKEELLELVDLARLSPTGANLQPLRFMLSNEVKTNELIFPNTLWAGYLQDWDGPVKGERPSAYIIILASTNSVQPTEYDAAIACQSILLGAVEKGIGGCIIGSIKRKELSQKISIPEGYKLSLIIALGKPKEEVVIDEVKEDNIKYWRDEKQVHHVPKRSLESLIISIDRISQANSQAPGFFNNWMIRRDRS